MKPRIIVHGDMVVFLPRTLRDLSDPVYLELGVFAHHVQVCSVGDNHSLAGLTPIGSVTFGFGCVETYASSNHFTMHHLPSRTTTSSSTQVLYSWGTWLVSSTRVMRYSPLYAGPWYVLLLERSIRSVNRTPRTHPSRVFRLEQLRRISRP